MLDKYGVGGEVAVDDRGGARMQVTVTNIMVNGNGPPQVGFYRRYLKFGLGEGPHHPLWSDSHDTPCGFSWLIRAHHLTPSQGVAANKSVRHHSEH